MKSSRSGPRNAAVAAASASLLLLALTAFPPLVESFVALPSRPSSSSLPPSFPAGGKANCVRRRPKDAASGVSSSSSRLSSTTEEREAATTTTGRRRGRTENEAASSIIDESILSKLSECETGTSARKVLDLALLGNDDDVLYGSAKIPRGASDRTVSDADLAIQTNVRNSKYSIMDLIELNGDRDADRASLSLLCVTVAGSVSALIAQQNLPGPDIVRFLVVWMLSFSPLAFVGLGIAIPSELQSFLVAVQRYVFPTYRKRMVQHEAGHFLLGHLLGMPIKGYRANAVRNAVEFYPLSDDDVGRDRAAMLGFDDKRNAESLAGKYEPATPEKGDGSFFGEGGRGADAVSTQSVFRNAKNYTANPFLQLPSQNEPTNSWPYRGFDHDTLDKLAVISVGGVCSEILAFGNAEGGYADLSQLRQLFNSAEPPLTEQEMDNRIRFALGYATSLLRSNLGALDALADVMARDGSVAECVCAIERCEDPTGGASFGRPGDYERRRREKLRVEGVGWLERLALGGGKNADAQDDGVVEGKGGGDRKPKFALTGDDPLYAAVAAAFAFFVWASNGGLSLH